MNKKGIFIPTLMIVFLVMLIYAYLALETKRPGLEETIGEVQINLIEQYQKGEEILFYIDQAAKYSIEKAEENGKLNKEKFLRSFNEYLQKFEATKDIKYKEEDLKIQGNYLIGQSEQEIVLKSENIEYKIKPKFKQKIKYISVALEEELFEEEKTEDEEEITI